MCSLKFASLVMMGYEINVTTKPSFGENEGSQTKR